MPVQPGVKTVMGIQLIAKVADEKAIESLLGANLAAKCEVFPVANDCFGVSIPTKVVDEVGESTVMGKLALLEHFDLWAGCWCKPKSKWKFW
jgi:hypothetical protein